MKMRIYKNLTDQCNILNSWDLMHIMRQIDKNPRSKLNNDKMQSRKLNRNMDDSLFFPS